jgi:hypothetical protein
MPKPSFILFYLHWLPLLKPGHHHDRSRIVNMGGAEEGIKTIMEVDSIAGKMATKST